MTLRIALVVLLCMGLAVVESVTPYLLHLSSARPDLLLVVVLYLALHDEVMNGAALSAVAGYLTDLTSATPAFLYTFLAVLTFVVLRLGGSALKTEGGIQSAAVAFGGSLIHSVIATLVFGFFTGAGAHFTVGPMVWSALGTAIAAPVVFFLLRRLDAGFLHVDSGALR
jgi:rod shape-determining protein MreD